MRAASNSILQPCEEETIAAAYNQTLTPQRGPGKSQARGEVVCVQGTKLVSRFAAASAEEGFFTGGLARN